MATAKRSAIYSGITFVVSRSDEKCQKHQEHEISSRKIRVIVAAHSKNFVILAFVVLTQYRSVTERQTDGRTDGSTMAKTPLALRAVAHKKSNTVLQSHCLLVVEHREVCNSTCYYSLPVHTL